MRGIKSIDDLIEEWHNSKSKLPLHEYLGMSEDEYKSWVLNKNPTDMINVDIDLEDKVMYFDPETPICEIMNIREVLDLDIDWTVSVKDDENNDFVYTFKPSA